MSERSDSSTSRTIRRRSVLALLCALFVPLSVASETSSEGQFRQEGAAISTLGGATDTETGNEPALPRQPEGFGAGGYGVSGYGI